MKMKRIVSTVLSAAALLCFTACSGASDTTDAVTDTPAVSTDVPETTDPETTEPGTTEPETTEAAATEPEIK